jgi:hypothetical protein
MPNSNTPAPVNPKVCPRCGVLTRANVGPGSGPHHASLRCPHCGAGLGWLSRYSEDERQARRQQGRLEALAQKAPSAPQLRYLATLGYLGPCPANMLEASELIDALLHKPTKRSRA